jgi:hypothetical protein
MHFFTIASFVAIAVQGLPALAAPIGPTRFVLLLRHVYPPADVSIVLNLFALLLLAAKLNLVKLHNSR